MTIRSVKSAPAVEKLSYTLIRSSRRTVSIEIAHDGSLIVRAPYMVSSSRVEGFIKQKLGWIAKRRADLLTHCVTPVQKTFSDGELFLYRGTSYPLELRPAGRGSVELSGSIIVSGSHTADPLKALLSWYKKEARALLEERLLLWSRKTGLRYSTMRLSGARTRWGSCTSRSVISLNWRLVMAPLSVLDYVVVHELVHTQVYNHTAEFWREVGKIIPDYKVKRDWLKKHRAEMMF
jgi:predicted metal-dependent hydrolase